MDKPIHESDYRRHSKWMNQFMIAIIEDIPNR